MKRESYVNTENMTDFNYYHDYHVSSKPERCQVLDLSRRRDSIETRKTPSPCNTLSSVETGSPNTNSESLFNPLLLRHSLAHQNNPAYALETLHHTKNSIVSNQISYPVVYPEFKCEETARSNFPYAQQQNLFQPINAIGSPPLQLPKIQQESQNVGATVEKDNGMAGVPAPATILYPKIFSNEGKPTRPFKAYPRDPMIIAANFAATDVLYNGPRVERYTEYRKRVLEQIQTANGGQRTITNPKMRRTNSRNGRQKRTHFASSESEDRCAESSDNDTGSTNGNNMLKAETEDSSKDNNNSPAVPNQNGSIKDAAYYERRRKNNAAAKKSRDRRRIKEDEIAIRAAYLERQNIELLCQLDALKAQLEALTKC